jgi:hypothetical protein
MNLRASDRRARDLALVYIDARDQATKPYLAKYPGRLPARVVRQIHRKALRLIDFSSSQVLGLDGPTQAERK